MVVSASPLHDFPVIIHHINISMHSITAHWIVPTIIVPDMNMTNDMIVIINAHKGVSIKVSRNKFHKIFKLFLILSNIIFVFYIFLLYVHLLVSPIIPIIVNNLILQLHFLSLLRFWHVSHAIHKFKRNYFIIFIQFSNIITIIIGNHPFMVTWFYFICKSFMVKIFM